MSVFVTVGTTDFVGLVESMCSDEIQRTLQSQGYSTINIQAGRHQCNVESCILKTTAFDYKDSIVPDMMKADLIISHAGAGTCLEALELKKDLVAVVNDSLMGNHQVELAEKLASEGYCDYATLSSLNSVLSNIKTKKKIIFPRQDDSLLSDFLRHRLEMD
ncbi:UDP-N-acetylglucosamine transferase subunit ALG13 homolog isoform X1 [Eurytemora carolleeae]|uniref:UDP-N-acetylglucosamine transferase subunit ALG13 homolog isoform X1 n=1 Tax=Eurytemora carolleeae TaxID=1294199 RepID=UPI000C78A9BA|nr:UDP-N-acetylglucosamine transferase subunit ALG13 homolog isoform X1 [Eurytemora carolleeae]|eukprot:XP_023322723.1 UDP-N-acetylglucosamine transferase subunit ALG13 homolog isoform X1 [Eurytemora affinis]